jgi:hypothetical protein
MIAQRDDEHGHACQHGDQELLRIPDPTPFTVNATLITFMGIVSNLIALFTTERHRLPTRRH